MKSFTPAIKQGTRIQNTRTRGGVVQATAKHKRLSKLKDATPDIVGVRKPAQHGMLPGTDGSHSIARRARPGLCLIKQPIGAVTVYYPCLYVFYM
jgi:hypothetical protein